MVYCRESSNRWPLYNHKMLGLWHPKSAKKSSKRIGTGTKECGEGKA